MVSIYLSPSVQEFNPTVLGPSEEYYMNLIADAMEPYLEASGIYFERNDRDESLGAAIDASNAGNFDLHLALHSNASPEGKEGQYQGPDVYYYADSPASRIAGEIIAGNLMAIYPNPELVQLLPNTTLAELRRTEAPAVLVEVAYHDNWDDAGWIANNINRIAYNLALSVTQYLGVPFVDPFV
ncbi:MAG: N-acetylmuramoyl-L-alanine amidase [Firmicutes bacterium]|nr:N-acetylmuramoyl-L-alanine amidase [Clostridiales bacterium]MBQ9930856.1 N-acetylmuramoyl-L-alanine amidase [Bacillota bacterium]